VPSDATGKLIGEGDFDAQVEQVFTDSRSLHQSRESAGQHIPRRDAADAAGLAD
jgi:hypothetical protein